MSPIEARQFTLSLFMPPTPERELPGFLDLDNQIRRIVNDMIDRSRKTREMIAAEMSRDTEKPITHHMLYAYTRAKEDTKFPLAYLPAFEKACGSYDLLEFLAAKRGCALLMGTETEQANLGRIEIMEQDLAREKARVQARIDQTRRLLEMAREGR